MRAAMIFLLVLKLTCFKRITSLHLIHLTIFSIDNSFRFVTLKSIEEKNTLVTSVVVWPSGLRRWF